MKVCKTMPGNGLHLDSRIKFHRAGAQRDHAAVQRIVLVSQTAHVTQHGRLGSVLVENRVGQNLVGAQESTRHSGIHSPSPKLLNIELDAVGQTD